MCIYEMPSLFFKICTYVRTRFSKLKQTHVNLFDSLKKPLLRYFKTDLLLFEGSFNPK